MSRTLVFQARWLALVACLFALPAVAQNFIVQCPQSTLLHPSPTLDSNGNWVEPAYTGPTNLAATGLGVPLVYKTNGGTIKCQQISGGDGYMTEADGNQTFMFAFGPLSGLNLIQNGQPGTVTPEVFDQPYCDPNNSAQTYVNGQPNPYAGGALGPCNLNGAVGYVPPNGYVPAVGEAYLTGNTAASTTPVGIYAVTLSNAVSGLTNLTFGAGYASPPLVNITPPPCTLGAPIPGFPTLICTQATATATLSNGSIAEVAITSPGMGYTAAVPVSFTPTTPVASIPNSDPAAIMNTGVMNGNIPAPLMAMDEDDEFFLTLTNVGMIMRPDLFEQHTVHFHGYPNASSFYDGVPDASLAINIGASFTYYYMAPDAGTYFWHCHITPPEHLQMGMVGQLFVRPRQNHAVPGASLYAVAALQQTDLRTSCPSNGESNLYNGTAGTVPGADILCSAPMPAANNTAVHTAGNKYIYNDGDGSTRYDIDVPLQMHGFDPNFHFVGMTFNPEGFSDMKDKYFLLNGRSYPDTVGVAAGSVPGWSGGIPYGTSNPDVGASAATPGTNSISTQDSDTQSRPSQPMSTLVVLSKTGGLNGAPQRAALRIADLSVSEYATLASLGIPMQVVGYNAKILRDQAGNNLYYTTNSITLGGGESLDVILDSALVPPGTYFLYTPNLDHLSNDAENFGGLMTEVVVTP